MEEDATRQLLQNRRMEMMAYLEDFKFAFSTVETQYHI